MDIENDAQPCAEPDAQPAALRLLVTRRLAWSLGCNMSAPLTRYASVGYCIYCNSSTLPLSDEHIIPFALNGSLILPRASCANCASITAQFEQTVARSMYGPFRIKRGYQTRRKKERPKQLPVYVPDEHGSERCIDAPLDAYPNVYYSLEAPLPGILRGIEPSSTNPELKISFKGRENEVSHAMNSLSTDEFICKFEFDWGAYFRQIAKIGHAFAFACTQGKAYEPLLPDIILGRSLHLAHYVGGVEPDTPAEALATDLSLSIICKPSGDYLVAGVQLLGVGTLHPYQAVVGRIRNIEAFVTASKTIFVRS